VILDFLEETWPMWLGLGIGTVVYLILLIPITLLGLLTVGVTFPVGVVCGVGGFLAAILWIDA
jgi:hypothetical protein